MISARPAHAKVLQSLAELPCYEAATEAIRLQEEALAYIGALAELRYQAAQELKDSGLTWPQVGEMLGVAGRTAMVLAQRGSPGRRRERRAQPVEVVGSSG